MVMFKFVQFWFYALQMRRSYYAAERAKNLYDQERAFKFLRKARRAGCAALQIRSPIVHKRWRAALKKNLVAVHVLYQQELIIQQIPEEDFELIVSAMQVLSGWAEMKIQPNVNQIAAMVDVFEVAKSSLNSVDDVIELSMVYGHKQVFAPLWNIMQPFLAGEVTREETMKRLDACAEKLHKWLPEMILFPHPQ